MQTTAYRMDIGKVILFHVSHKYLSSMAASKMHPQTLFIPLVSAEDLSGVIQQLPENICETQGFGDGCLSLGKLKLAFATLTERAAIIKSGRD